MSNNESLKNCFLIAMPALNDPNFGQSVIYVSEHNESGAMGLIVNKPLQINLGSVLEHLSIKITDQAVNSIPVLSGGPVGQEHGFVIHDLIPPDQEDEEIIISASKDILKSIANGQGPDHFIVTLGYAGWSAGQVEREISRNDWLVAPFNSDILFNTPVKDRWHAAAELIGIDINRISDQVGHA